MLIFGFDYKSLDPEAVFHPSNNPSKSSKAVYQEISCDSIPVVILISCEGFSGKDGSYDPSDQKEDAYQKWRRAVRVKLLICEMAEYQMENQERTPEDHNVDYTSSPLHRVMDDVIWANKSSNHSEEDKQEVR